MGKAVEKKKASNLDGIRVLFDIDEFTWGDLEDLDSKSPAVIRRVIQKNVEIPGYDSEEEKSTFLRGLSIAEMNELGATVFGAMQSVLDPKDSTGKN